MANGEQLSTLSQGATTWNAWRKKYPYTKIDLSNANLTTVEDLCGADLRGADLRLVRLSKAQLNEAKFIGADLSGADLGAANLIRADLTRADLNGVGLKEADLSGANLIRADLNGANLTGVFSKKADLRRANLTRTNLNDANLTGANLIGANLTEADLRGADLTETIVGGVSFDNVNLSQVKGLETVKHSLGSTIGIDTIYKSKGNIPEVFLRGCGVPEDMIAYVRSLTGKAFEFYSCFISYSSKDKEFAKRLHSDLQSKGIRVWFAPEDLKIGDRIQETIEDAIRIYDKLLIVLSTNSIESAWVEHEIKTGLKKEEQKKRTVLFPVRLDDAVMETTQQWAFNVRRNRHIGDFCKWQSHDDYQKSFERLVRDLQAGEEGGK